MYYVFLGRCLFGKRVDRSFFYRVSVKNYVPEHIFFSIIILMKTYWGVEIQLYAFSTSAPEGGEWSAS
jgi:hypothetical protein